MHRYGFDVPHVLAAPATYDSAWPKYLRARFCPDCTAGQYAVRGRVLRETSHYCPGDASPVLVHWPADS